MAILTRLMGMLGAILALAGCGVLPNAPQLEPVRQGIGWLDRQFKTCADKDCPAATRKTLAVVELPRQPAARTLPIAADPTPAPKDKPFEVVTERIIHFDFGKSLPTDTGLKALRNLVPLASKATRIEVHGRTDDIGSKAYNDRLAKHRAEHVRDWLASEGIEALIEVRAEGMCCYLDSSRTEAARRNNRRVEVRLVHFVPRRDAVSNSKGVQ